MSTNIDWGKLVAQNRVKAPGIPWTDKEMEAIYKKGMKPDDVRNGFLDPSELEEDATDKPKKLERMTKAELVVIAKELGIVFEEKVATKGDLILEINNARKDEEKGKGKKDDDEKEDDEKGIDDQDEEGKKDGEKVE